MSETAVSSSILDAIKRSQPGQRIYRVKVGENVFYVPANSPKQAAAVVAQPELVSKNDANAVMMDELREKK